MAERFALARDAEGLQALRAYLRMVGLGAGGVGGGLLIWWLTGSRTGRSEEMGVVQHLK